VKSYTDIRDELIERVASKTPFTNFSTSSGIRNLLEIFAYVIASLYNFVFKVAQQGFLMSATGEWLDLRARECGVERLPGNKAQLWITFNRTASANPLTIPAGNIVKSRADSSGNEYRFSTIQPATIPANESFVRVLAEAEAIGTAYNIGSGTVTRLVTSISGITSVINDDFLLANGKTVSTLYREGSDIETDGALRKRAQLAWQAIGVGGNRAAYEQWALSVPGVRSVQILDDFPFGPGTVGVVVLGVDGMPSSQLLSDVLLYLRQRKPLTSDVRVVGPSKRTIDVSVNVWRFSDADRETIDNTARQVIQIHTDKLLLGEGLLVARLLQAILNIDGVYNVRLLLPAQDLLCGPTEFLELGALTIEHFLKGRSYQDTGIIIEPVETTDGESVPALKRENFY